MGIADRNWLSDSGQNSWDADYKRINARVSYNKISYIKMDPETITHSINGCQFTVKLEDGALLLQLKVRGPRNREIIAQNLYIYEDLPQKIQAFGDMKEVH